MNRINVTSSSMPDIESYFDEIRQLWSSKWLTNSGKIHKELEAELRRYLGAKYVNLFTNGHLALEGILEAYALKGEVITTPFTFASTTHAIVRKGLKPVFCDINEDDYTMDVDKIEALITDQTVAILPVHVYGHICNVEGIEALSKKYNLKVIYDAAHAFGITYKGKNVTEFGDASMLSFHATKVFNTIEGGAIVSKDERISEQLELIVNYGITGQEKVDYPGGNGKMNEFQAAMGICNLKMIDGEIQKRKEMFELYMNELKGVEGLIIRDVQEHIQHNYSYMPILIDGFRMSRDEIYAKLNLQNIHSRKYFYPLVSDYGCYKNDYDSSLTPIAKKIADNILTLPLYSELNEADIRRVCGVIKGD